MASRSCGRHLTSATLPHNSSVALLFSSFLLHWLRSTRDPRRRTRLGWSRTHTHTPERSHTAQERERDTHTRTWRASLHSHSSSSPLHGGKRWARPEPCLVSTSLANLHRQRSYGGRGAVRAGVWTTPLPRKASILPCATKAAHYTPCCPTFAFPSPNRRTTQFSRGLRRPFADNLHKQPRQSSSIALLFSFLLLHWLRSTRDPRRYTRLDTHVES